MTRTLILERSDNGESYHLTGNTELGRGDFPSKQWQTDRAIPRGYYSLDTRLCLMDDYLVSRNHAGIFWEGGEYHIFDLVSRNGTYLNGRSVHPFAPEPLQLGDLIRVGNTRFRVSYDDIKHYALLVGAGSDNIGASEADVQEMAELLKGRGYTSRILIGSDVTKKNLRNEFRRFVPMATAESDFLFMFHGHGGQSGLSVGGQVVDPKTLYKEIRKIRSRKKAVILEACKSGLFVNKNNKLRIPQNTLVLTASSEIEHADETMAGDGRYTGRLQRALTRYFRTRRGSFDLREAYTHFMTEDAELHRTLQLQDPQMEGDSFYLDPGVSIIESHVGSHLFGEE